MVGLINGILCIFGLPFMHAVLPHSPLHVKCLADTEEHVEAGHVKNIVVYVRETRLTNLFSNILIGISLFFLYYVLQFIPTAVLDGRCTKLINLKLRPKVAVSEAIILD